MSDRTWGRWASRELDGIRDAGQWRTPRDLDAAGPEGKLTLDGRPVVSFASNDYLGLTQHPAVLAAAHAALDRWGAGAGAARLIVGSRPVHHDLEEALATWRRTDRAVLFPTGFMANLGVVTTFAGPGTLVCSDALNHASIVDGCRLSRADVAIYRHADVEHLASLVHNADGRQVVVVTDSVFSMDGDLAPLDEIAALCRDTGALLVLDEAHAVLGPDPDLDGVDALRIGTLSKTHGSLGGFVACSERFADLFVNRARSYIFTTAPTPADTAAALAATSILGSEAGDALRARLRAHIERVRPGHPSPIIAVLCGDADRAVLASDALLDRGVLVPAIRPPTVAPGTSRLRITLSAAHSEAQVDALRRRVDRPRPPIPGSGVTTTVFVTGTGTEVGKTWWSVALIRGLRDLGVLAAARKPAQSFLPGAGPTDAELLADAAGIDPTLVCPPARWYEIPLAPPMAAASLDRPTFSIADLAGETAAAVDRLDRSNVPTRIHRVLFVEGAGGPRSPIADDGDNVDLARAIAPDLVVLVADAGLGTINAVRLAAEPVSASSAFPLWWR